MDTRIHWRSFGRERRSRILGFFPADKRSVLVIQFVRNMLGSRLRSDEFHFAHQRAAPGLVDARAELSLHFIQLLLPRFALRGNFQASALAANRLRARSKSR